MSLFYSGHLVLLGTLPGPFYHLPVNNSSTNWNVSHSLLFVARLFFSRPAIANRNRDSRVLAVEFTEKFESKYGSQHVAFFKGGYSQALEKARKDLRFLLVILQSDDHDDTDLFNR